MVHHARLQCHERAWLPTSRGCELIYRWRARLAGVGAGTALLCVYTVAIRSHTAISQRLKHLRRCIHRRVYTGLYSKQASRNHVVHVYDSEAMMAE